MVFWSENVNHLDAELLTHVNQDINSMEEYTGSSSKQLDKTNGEKYRQMSNIIFVSQICEKAVY